MELKVFQTLNGSNSNKSTIHEISNFIYSEILKVQRSKETEEACEKLTREIVKDLNFSGVPSSTIAILIVVAMEFGGSPPTKDEIMELYDNK